MKRKTNIDSYPAARLEAAFQALSAVLPAAPARAPKQFYALQDLKSAFKALRKPLAVAKEEGGLMNVWALARLGQDEVRNATALAGLWMSEFGGKTSLRFLAYYLASALPGVEWGKELEDGYRVETEVCPMGDAADRVDLVIQTAHYLIGVEVKIRAGLGHRQLERYSASIARRATLEKLTPRVILLAPFRAAQPEISSTTWADVVRAARTAVKEGAKSRTFVQQIIASFGEHIRTF